VKGEWPNNMVCDQILTGDCIEILAHLPDASVDVVFADPPYNLQLSQDLWRPNRTRVDAVKDVWDKFSSFQEYDQFTRSWLSECRKVLKDTGTLWVIGTYHNIYRVGTILQDLGFWILNDVIYIKTNPMPNFRGIRFTNAHETLIWAQKKKGKKYTFNHHAMKALNDDLQMRSDWLLPIVVGKERIKSQGMKAHSTQKPEALLYRVLLSSTNAGDLVLDPFFGTGTTGAVAKKLGRHFVGIEKNETYVKIAQERIAGIEFASTEAVDISNPRRQKRVPFGSLLETGLVQPGQTIYFTLEDLPATVLADGHIQCGQIVGSIHTVAKSLLGGTPANGWDCWFFDDENGSRKSIDKLRQQIHKQSDSNISPTSI
jgi:site-specific DNA-methyltransferase (adenine-specific)